MRQFGIIFLLMIAAPAAALTDADIASIGLEQPAASAGADAAQPPSLGELAGRVVLALGVVLGLMGGAAWAARRWMPGRLKPAAARQGIEILATRAIGPRRSLLLVRTHGRTILLGATPQSIQTLSEFDAAADWAAAAGDADAPADFESELRRGTTLLEKR